MKFLINRNDDLDHLMVQGWTNALNSLGHEVVSWDHHYKSPFDIFDEAKPDVFIGSISNLSRGIITCLKDYPYVQTLLHSPHPSLIQGKDVGAIRIDWVFTYFRGESVKSDISRIIGPDTPVLSLPKAADSIAFGPHHKSDHIKWKSDVAVFVDPTEETFPLLTDLCNMNFSIRIFSKQEWPFAQYCGFVQQENIPKIVASTPIIITYNDFPKSPPSLPPNVLISKNTSFILNKYSPMKEITFAIQNILKNLYGDIDSILSTLEGGTYIDRAQYLLSLL